MSSEWPMVKLGDVLIRSNEQISIDPNKRYQQITVKLWGKGVVQRAELLGSEIAATRQYVVKPQQFILSRIDARNGAFGLIPGSLDGAVVSNDFPVLDLNRGVILPEFLEWMSKTHWFVDLCKQASEGTTNRIRLKEESFLSAEIPLPSLNEQRRIVARIDALAERIAEARGLRAASLKEMDSFVEAEEMQIWPTGLLDQAVSLESVTCYLTRGRQSQQGISNHYLIKTQHVQMGKYLKTNITLSSDVAEKVHPEALLVPGDILIACSAAGCLGRVAQYSDNVIASTDTHVAIARANPNKVLPAYLYKYLKGGQGQFQLRSRERGDWQREKISFRLTELNLTDLKLVPVPVPPLDEQHHIVAYLDALQAKVDAVKALQAETAAELDALLPSVLDKAFRGEL